MEYKHINNKLHDKVTYKQKEDIIDIKEKGWK